MKRIISIIIPIIFIILMITGCNNAKEDITVEVDQSVIDDEGTESIGGAEHTTKNNEANNIEETSDNRNYNEIDDYLKEECENVFSPYYKLLDFEISNYKEEVINGNVEAVFFFKVIHKNYDKDPDTVGYIKEAKENGSSNYQQLYDEYLQTREMNFELKIMIDENGLITLYSNSSPKGIKWEETKMSDFILSKDS